MRFDYDLPLSAIIIPYLRLRMKMISKLNISLKECEQSLIFAHLRGEFHLTVKEFLFSCGTIVMIGLPIKSCRI